MNASLGACQARQQSQQFSNVALGGRGLSLEALKLFLSREQSFSRRPAGSQSILSLGGDAGLGCHCGPASASPGESFSLSQSLSASLSPRRASLLSCSDQPGLLEAHFEVCTALIAVKVVGVIQARRIPPSRRRARGRMGYNIASLDCRYCRKKQLKATSFHINYAIYNTIVMIVLYAWLTYKLYSAISLPLDPLARLVRPGRVNVDAAGRAAKGSNVSHAGAAGPDSPKHRARVHRPFEWLGLFVASPHISSWFRVE